MNDTLSVIKGKKKAMKRLKTFAAKVRSAHRKSICKRKLVNKILTNKKRLANIRFDQSKRENSRLKKVMANTGTIAITNHHPSKENKAGPHRESGFSFSDHQLILLFIQENMPETQLHDQEPKLAPCPKNVCDCGYYLATTMIENTSIKHGLRLTKSEEKNIMNSIQVIHTLDEFQMIRKHIRERFGITFLIQGNGTVKIDESRNLCRKTRRKVRETFNNLFSEHSLLLMQILNRDSLFSEEG